MRVSEKGWVGWVLANKTAAGGAAAALVLVASGLVVVAARSGDDSPSSAAPKVKATDSTVAGETTTSLAPGVTGVTGVTAPAGTAARATATTRRVATSGTLPPNLGNITNTCVDPKPGYTTKGLTDKKVTIGQLYTESNILPQQFKPANEGLQAAVKLLNDSGGVCGRTIELKGLADNGVQPAGSGSYTDNWNSLKSSIFTWVGNSSLRDGDTYNQDGPFDQNAKDGSEQIPDIGGLALSYGRSQSPWYAGNVGSISPSLVGGGAFKSIVDEAKAGGGSGKGACKAAGFLYLTEPTGASSDSAMAGGAAISQPWGGGISNVKYYQQQLAATVTQYEQTVAQMVADGVNCVFTYADLQSNINLVKAMANRQVWPPAKCTGPTCFSVVYIPFAGYDAAFYNQGGEAADNVTTFIPHVPLNETSDASMATYLKALGKISGNSGPSSFSIIGYSAGLMFAKGLAACGAAPTRKCMVDWMRGLTNFDAGGLLGPITPFKSTRVNCSSGCGSFSGRSTYDFKWIFPCSAYLRVSVKNGKRDFYRYSPTPTGYNCDTLHIVRGTPG